MPSSNNPHAKNWEIRYNSEIYGSALHSIHDDYDKAREARARAIVTAVEHGNQRLAKSFEIV